MPKHQAPRGWAKAAVTELPAPARWAPSGGCRNSLGREAGAGERAGDKHGSAAETDRAGRSKGQTGQRKGGAAGSHPAGKAAAKQSIYY